MAHVQNRAAEGDHREVSVSLLKVRGKYHKEGSVVHTDLLADYQVNLIRKVLCFLKNAGE